MSHYCPSLPKLGIGKRGETKVYDLLLYTRSLCCISELHSLFYENGIKRIPAVENIYELLTPVALAHIIKGDGTRRGQGLILCTHSYSLPDVVRLINVLIIKYILICTLQMYKQKQPTIYISSKCKKLFTAIVLPYFAPSILYKIGLDKSTASKDSITRKNFYSTSNKIHEGMTVSNTYFNTHTGLKDFPVDP